MTGAEPGPDAEAAERAEAQARHEEAQRLEAARIMRTQARRAWLVPLLAVPIVELVTAPEVPAEFLPYEGAVLDEARGAAGKMAAILARMADDPAAALTDDDAFTLISLAVGHRGVVELAMSHRGVVRQWLGMPGDLSGPGLVRRLSQAVRERPEPPALLGLAIAVLLAEDRVDRQLVPLADGPYQDVTRALDERCYALGLRTWEDALRHAAAAWTPETWRGLLMTMALGTGRAARSVNGEGQGVTAERPPEPASPPRARSGRARRSQADLQTAERLAAAERERDAAKADATAARQREAELVSARDAARSRVVAQETRVAELERELQAVRGVRRALEADLRRLRGEPEPEPPPVVAPEPIPADLLRGRPVYLFTGQVRAGAREEMAESLRAIGAEDLRVFHVDEGSPGPEVFPPGSLVVVDTRFAGHRHTDGLKSRAARSPDVVYLSLQGGQGGLAVRVAERLRRRD